jgi:SAM-dependent methyltransferase
MCSSCFAIPSISIKLIGTSVALLYGQRSLTANSHKYTRRITFTVSFLISLALSGIGIFLFVLSVNPELRRRNFVNLCVGQNLKGSPLDEHRCGILNEGNVTGRVMEFGAGPGTNFKCWENTNIQVEKYVVVEPNTYFEEKLQAEKQARGLEFPLEFVGLKGESVDIAEDGTFDVVVLTHVLCSVDSPEVVLANADRALKPGGRIIFMEHSKELREGTTVWYLQQVAAPILAIVGNGCKFLDMRSVIEGYLSNDRFELEMLDFDAPMPKMMTFARPHVKGVATKR